MEPIHQAALNGDVAAIARLVAEDFRRVNAQIQGTGNWVDYWPVNGRSPLMLAAWKGHDAAVARLLALGADVGLEADGDTAAHCACRGGDHSSVLALLLDAGASIHARSIDGWTPLVMGASRGRTRCVALLINHGGDALDVNVKGANGSTALLRAADYGHADIVRLLLQAGADPTIPVNDGGWTALGVARCMYREACIALLEAALVEPQRTRALFKARALLDAAHDTHKARTGAQAKGHPAALQQQAAMAAAPIYLKQRVAQAQELPQVSILIHINYEEQLAACKYALGLESGGIVLAEGQEPTVGMLPEVLVELLEMMVPKWDPARKGRPLGEGYIEVGDGAEFY